MSLKTISAAAILSLGSVTSALYAQQGPSLSGVFVGAIHFNDGAEKRDIHLQVSLSRSEETEPVETPNGIQQRYIIDAAFSLDHEGGPYIFSKVNYDVDLNILDMRYSRNPAENSSAPAPASLRFTGKFNSDGSIEGYVTSGFYGRIGTFNLAKTDLDFLTQTPKYFGRWVAKPDWTEQVYGLSIEPGIGDTLNPPGLELGFTPGKLGNFGIDRKVLTPFPLVNIGLNRTSIDYLRRRMVISSTTTSGTNISLDCKILEPTMDLECTLRTINGGLKGKVFFKKVDVVDAE